MKLWQKNLLATLLLFLVVMALVCALLIHSENQTRYAAEQTAVLREFSSAVSILRTTAALYPGDSAEQRQSVIRAVQVTANLGRGQWLLIRDGVRMMGSMPLDYLPASTQEAQSFFYETPQGPVFLCAQQAEGYILYGAWDASVLWQDGRALAWRMGVILLGASMLLAAGIYLLGRKMFGPLGALEKGAKAVAGGDYSLRLAPCRTEDLNALSQSFNRMAQAVETHIGNLEKENQVQRRFVQNLSHEMKTPLTAMLGYSELLLAGRIEEAEKASAYQYIAQQSRRLNELALKLLSLSRLENGEGLAFVPLSVQKITVQAMQAAGPLAEKKGLLLTAPVQDAEVSGDPDLLLTLTLNLLTNACKASPAGGTVSCAIEKEGASVRLSVSDAGDGVPEASLPLLTEAFYMVDKSRARKENGAGVGLTLCREIARLHGGRLTFENLHPGFRASVILPALSADASRNLQNGDISATHP